MIELQLEQGSPEWHAYRKTRIGASDISCVLGLNPWKSAYQLYQEKMGLVPDQKENAAMSKGKELEPLALNEYNEFYKSTHFKPYVFQSLEHPWMFASMDGYCPELRRAVEIKCSVKAYNDAIKGTIPDYYKAQMTQQMIVCGLNDIDYMAYFNAHTFCIISYEFDPFLASDIITKGKEFYDNMIQRVPPPLSDSDYVVMDDAAFYAIENAYCDLVEKKKIIEKELEEHREWLEEKSAGRNVKGSRIKITVYDRKGSIDYGNIPELSGIDLEHYRKPTVRNFRITEI